MSNQSKERLLDAPEIYERLRETISMLQMNNTELGKKNLILVELIFKNSCQAIQLYQVLPSQCIIRLPLRAKRAVRRSVACAC